MPWVVVMLVWDVLLEGWLVTSGDVPGWVRWLVRRTRPLKGTGYAVYYGSVVRSDDLWWYIAHLDLKRCRVAG